MKPLANPQVTQVRERALSQAAFSLALHDHLALFNCLAEIRQDVEVAAETIIATLDLGKKLMLCGNGGSAADSQHIAAELTGRFVTERQPLAAMALTTDTSALTCIANDYEFNEVFARQLTGLGRPGDCLLAISTSGNSENVIRAVEAARRMNISTIGLTGRGGGRLREVCDACVVIPSTNTARIQEAHIFVGHVLCSLIEQKHTRRTFQQAGYCAH